jgi:DNA-binding transcriptional MerR regulator
MSNPDPKPGDLAKLAGKRPSSVRYYEQIGVQPQPARVSGQRRYDARTERTPTVIDTARRAGLTLEEIRALLSASPDDSSVIDKLRQMAERSFPRSWPCSSTPESSAAGLSPPSAANARASADAPFFDDPPPDATPGQRRITAAAELRSVGSAQVSPAGASCRT